MVVPGRYGTYFGMNSGLNNNNVLCGKVENEKPIFGEPCWSPFLPPYLLAVACCRSRTAAVADAVNTFRLRRI